MLSGLDQSDAGQVADSAAINGPTDRAAEQVSDNVDAPSELETSAPNENAQPRQSPDGSPQASEKAPAEGEAQENATETKSETSAENVADKPPSAQTSARNLLEAQRDMRVAEMSERAVAAAEGEPKPLVARRLAQAMAFVMSQVRLHAVLAKTDCCFWQYTRLCSIRDRMPISQ